jgi:hypothetical protein
MNDIMLDILMNLNKTDMCIAYVWLMLNNYDIINELLDQYVTVCELIVYIIHIFSICTTNIWQYAR